MFYRLLLAHETIHRLNRIVLLSTALLSFMLPLCVITFHKVVTVAPMTDIQVGVPEMAVVGKEEAQPWWLITATIVFIAGALFTLGHSLFSVIQVMRLISKSEKHPQTDGTTIVVTDEGVSPFSWMRYIVLNRSDYDSPDAAILAHERGHIRHHHSWDLLFTFIATTLQWFNPAIWMLRSDLRSIHEFEADKEVLSQGINARQYQLLLVTKAMATGGYSVVNSLSHSTLKKRINMMLKKKSSAVRGWKALFALPVIAVSLALNAKTETIYLSDDNQGTTTPAASLDDSSSTLSSVLSEMTEVDDNYLYIVDGKQMTNISGIPSSDIESMTVVRGDAARQLGYNRNVVIVKLKKKGDAPTSASSESNEDIQVCDVCEQMPEFPGGMTEMLNFLSSTLKYPKAAAEAGTQGRVLVRFIINEAGEVTDASILQGVDELLDKEALRVVGEMPAWIPGRQDGKAVRVRYTLPISFMLPREATADKANTATEPRQESETPISIRSSGDSKVVKVLIDGKTAENVRIYIDDVEKSAEDMRALPPSSIDHINMDKSDGKGIIRIYTKK